MIGRITGKLISKQPPQLLVDVMGVGYEVEAPMSTFYKLPPVGETISLLTHLTVREDAHLLFGFATASEKELFRDLIKISGVGPKLALSILSGVNADDFWGMVRAGDTARLTKIPGVGKKTAERLVIEMRDKAGAAESTGIPGTALGIAAGPLQEARAALNALGYKPAEIQRFTEAVYKDGMTTEQIIQEALKRAVR
ncbi:Holliday junction branch migration protein RuvA [Stenotrophobium rhamnosiphilum]|uniref:Holliday junction branch migration complex subunit RuvA n=1 Tax=Stenotrophobium rhamnosiphilum TaxID=2029166 RepID=A0A2T5MHA7_9GAMM|nr:Holliday junction branch migration protein RuvA [Stenotrophobium rhamnosiphilum]PTU31955.1 Holliday junction branch migration protein RuvA [Stenotrophobium rhamnosiphilum]